MLFSSLLLILTLLLFTIGFCAVVITTVRYEHKTRPRSFRQLPSPSRVGRQELLSDRLGAEKLKSQEREDQQKPGLMYSMAFIRVRYVYKYTYAYIHINKYIYIHIHLSIQIFRYTYTVMNRPHEERTRAPHGRGIRALYPYCPKYPKIEHVGFLYQES